MIKGPKNFPIDKQSHFFLEGPVGQLEVMTTVPKNDASKGIAVICHPHPLYEGTMHNKVVHTLAKAFDNKGLKTVRFNFRGVGKSEGSFGDAVGETGDLMAVVEWVKQVIPDTRLWLAGFSFGSYVAARGAQTLNPVQLITVAPAVTRYSFDDLKTMKMPWLIVQGTEDEVIDPKSVQTWAKALKSKQDKVEYCELDDTGHYFHSKLIDLRTLVENHFVEVE